MAAAHRQSYAIQHLLGWAQGEMLVLWEALATILELLI